MSIFCPFKYLLTHIVLHIQLTHHEWYVLLSSWAFANCYLAPMNDICILSRIAGRIDQPLARQWIKAALGRDLAWCVAANYIWVLMWVLMFFFKISLQWALIGIRGSFHKSPLDPQPHYCVRAFCHDGHVYKAMHVHSNTKSTYNGKVVGQFGKRLGMALDLSLECVNLG